jgi:hypothetical protein
MRVQMRNFAMDRNLSIRVTALRAFQTKWNQLWSILSYSFIFRVTKHHMFYLPINKQNQIIASFVFIVRFIVKIYNCGQRMFNFNEVINCTPFEQDSV